MLIPSTFVLSTLALATPGADPAEPAPALVAPAPAALQTESYLVLPYAYLEARYVRRNTDGFGEDPEGFDVRFSRPMGETWFLHASLQMLEGEAANSDVDVETFEIGLGLHTAISPRVDMVLSASWIELDADRAAPGPSNDDGYRLRGGLRTPLGARAEVGAGLFYLDLEESGDEVGFYVDSAFYFQSRMGFTISYEAMEDVESIGIGIRLAQ